MVCRAFLLAFRILGKIILTKGDTERLKDGTPHCNVRRDFYDTDVGIQRVKEVVVVEPDTSTAQDAGCEFCILLSYSYAYCYSLRSLLYTPCCCLVWPV
jgi:hypothetical protein